MLNKYYKNVKFLLIESENIDYSDPGLDPQIINSAYSKLDLSEPLLGRTSNAIEKLASNPMLAQAQLTHIATKHADNLDIAKAILKNPNASVPALGHAAYYARHSNIPEIFHSGALEMNAWSDPNFLDPGTLKTNDTHLKGLRRIAMHPETPANIQDIMAQYPVYHNKLAKNSSLHPKVADQLFNIANKNVEEKEDTELHELLGTNENLPDHIFNHYLKQHLNDPQNPAFKFVLQNPRVPHEILKNAVDDFLTRPNAEAIDVAKNPNLHPELVDKLANYPYRLNHINLIKHPNISPQTINKIALNIHDAGSYTYNLAHKLLDNPHLSKEALDHIASTNLKYDGDIITKIRNHLNF